MQHTNEVTGRLENWFPDKATKKEFIIWGNIYEDNDGRWADGYFIHTSGILHRKVSEGDVVQTRNSSYLLGKPKEEK